MGALGDVVGETTCFLGGKTEEGDLVALVVVMQVGVGMIEAQMIVIVTWMTVDVVMEDSMVEGI